MLKSLFDIVTKLLKYKKTQNTSSLPIELPADLNTTPPDFEIEFIPSPNFSSRKDKKIKCVVLHHTAGSFKSAINWLKNKESGVSAHYVISRTGKIVQMVDEKDKAWHAGKSEWKNEYDIGSISIGIELEGDGKTPFTEEQYVVTAKLCKTLKKKYNITDDWIVGHKDIAPGRKTDPSPWDDKKFFNLLNN
jgi:N-acetylmuramoyl-L-alanine amidase